MSKAPHHATAALARKYGITLTANGNDTYTATSPTGGSITDSSAKSAVAIVVASLPKQPKVKKPVAKKTNKAGGKKQKNKKASHSGVMKIEYYNRYRKLGGNCGDDLAKALTETTTVLDTGKSGKAKRRKTDLKALKAVAKENNVDASGYSALNLGMVRMDVSNKLRAIVREGGTVTISGKKFKGSVNAAGGQDDADADEE